MMALCASNLAFAMDRPAYLNAQLLLSARDGDQDNVQELLNQGVDVNHADQGGHTALIWAIKSQHLEIIDLLITRGADINTTDKRGGTALSWAALTGNQDCVRLLIKKGANIDQANNNLNTPFRSAAIFSYKFSHREVCKILIDTMLKLTKKQKNDVVALLAGLKGKQSRDINKLIAQELVVIYKRENKQQVIEKIHKFELSAVNSKRLLEYATQKGGI